MPLYNAGKTMREFRKRKHISQEALCDGLCEPPTLSKIEGGRQNPTKKLFEALMSRLGAPVAAFNIPVTQTEYERAQIEREISSRLANNDYDIVELVAAYKAVGTTMDKLEMQFYLFVSAISKSNDTERACEKRELFLSAMRQTYPDFTLDTDFSERFLTIFELVILNNIAICYRLGGETEKAVQLLLRVESYFRMHDIEREEYARQYPVILDNLVSWLCVLGNLEQAKDFAQKGVDCCIKYGKLSPLPFLVYNLGYLQVTLREERAGKAHIEQAVSLLALMNRHDDIRRIQDDVVNSFGENFWKMLKI